MSLFVGKSKEKKKAAEKAAETKNPFEEEEKIKPRFKASPVISPVYGVLDKNYTKEEVKDENKTKKVEE